MYESVNHALGAIMGIIVLGWVYKIVRGRKLW